MNACGGSRAGDRSSWQVLNRLQPHRLPPLLIYNILGYFTVSTRWEYRDREASENKMTGFL